MISLGKVEVARFLTTVHSLQVISIHTNVKCLTSVKQMYNFKSASKQQPHTHRILRGFYAIYALSSREKENETRASQSDCDISVLDPLNFITYDVHLVYALSLCVHTHYFLYSSI